MEGLKEENAPAPERQWSSIRFLTDYYRTALGAYEAFDYAASGRAQLLSMAEEASALRRIILDYIDEGYTRFTDELIEGTDALRRLDRILERALGALEGDGERHHFGLYPHAVTPPELPAPLDGEGAAGIELNDYLHGLLMQPRPAADLTPYFADGEQMAHWLRRTDALMAEMVEFLLWIADRLRRRPDHVPVALLRDTLLVWIGLDWLYRRGELPRAPRPLFMSRRFVDAQPESEGSYPALVSEALYATLLNGGRSDLGALRRGFAARAQAHPEVSQPFAAASREYLAALELDGPPLLLETGWHGTFPLWVLTMNGGRGEFLLYSTSPWLYPLYRDIVYTGNCNNLRDFETIVLHDKLFQFEHYAGGRVTVRENASAAVRDLAQHELRRFRELLEARVSTQPRPEVH